MQENIISCALGTTPKFKLLFNNYPMKNGNEQKILNSQTTNCILKKEAFRKYVRRGKGFLKSERKKIG